MPASELQASKMSKRCQVNLDSELESRLCGYVAADRGVASPGARTLATAVAISAVGIGTLVMSEEAQARIVYTPTLKHFVCRSTGILTHCQGNLEIDINNDGLADAAFFESARGSTTVYRHLSAKGLGGNEVMQASTLGCAFQQDYALPLNNGQRIGPSGKFGSHGVMLQFTSRAFGTRICAPWRNLGEKYLGVKLSIDGETHYGWVRVLATITGLYIHGAVTGYAYETVPNVPIAAGIGGGPISQDDTQRGDGAAVQAGEAAPERHPATLGFLAAGEPGLAFWRARAR